MVEFKLEGKAYVVVTYGPSEGGEDEDCITMKYIEWCFGKGLIRSFSVIVGIFAWLDR